MNSPLLTIFIPTFKRPKLLVRSITSALQQTFCNFQVIVCDNGSNDETEELVAEIKKTSVNLFYYKHNVNIGMLGNYQFAASLISTPFFSFLSDDDLLLPMFCEVAMKSFSEFPDIAFSACSSIIYSPIKGVVRVPLDLWKREGLFLPEEGLLELPGKYPIPNTVIFQRKFVDRIVFDAANPLAWDCDFLLQIAAKHPFSISKKICGIFYHHSTSYSAYQEFSSTRNSIERLIERSNYFSYFNPFLKHQLQTNLQNDLLAKIEVFGLVHLSKGMFDETRDLISQLPFSFRKMIYFILYRICKAVPLLASFLSCVKSIRSICLRMKFRALGYEKIALKYSSFSERDFPANWRCFKKDC